METNSNLKNIIVGTLTIIILILMGYTFSIGGAYHGGEQGKVIQNISNVEAKKNSQAMPEEKDDRAKEMDKLAALRDKAGSGSAFKVSNEFKSKCSSCHGVNGTGEQNGRKLMGPKLFGQSAKEIYEKLVAFKTGRKENLIMKGLLIPLKDEDLKRFAEEIGEFPLRAKQSNE